MYMCMYVAKHSQCLRDSTTCISLGALVISNNLSQKSKTCSLYATLSVRHSSTVLLASETLEHSQIAEMCKSQRKRSNNCTVCM